MSFKCFLDHNRGEVSLQPSGTRTEDDGSKSETSSKFTTSRSLGMFHL